MTSAAALAADEAPLVTSIERVSSYEVRAVCSLSDGTEIVYDLTHSDRDGVEGDAPDSVITAVERRLADGDAFASDADDWERDDGYRHAPAPRFEAPL